MLSNLPFYYALAVILGHIPLLLRLPDCQITIGSHGHFVYDDGCRFDSVVLSRFSSGVFPEPLITLIFSYILLILNGFTLVRHVFIHILSVVNQCDDSRFLVEFAFELA